MIKAVSGLALQPNVRFSGSPTARIKKRVEIEAFLAEQIPLMRDSEKIELAFLRTVNYLRQKPSADNPLYDPAPKDAETPFVKNALYDEMETRLIEAINIASDWLNDHMQQRTYVEFDRQLDPASPNFPRYYTPSPDVVEALGTAVGKYNHRQNL